MFSMYKLDDLQDRATDPEALIWVNANAGTGKTTVLTTRVLKLLLTGTRPSKILCLTYTKAAASEMQNRIIDRLRHWVTLEHSALSNDIQTLTGTKPSNIMMQHARGLFIEVLESAEGLNVQTIHSFAQSLLRRFPIEAGISPYFRIMDEQESTIYAEQAMQLMLQNLQAGNLPQLEQAAAKLINETSEDSLKKILQSALQDVMKWKQLIEHPGGIEKFKTDLFALFDIASDLTVETLQEQFIATDGIENEQIKTVISYFEQEKYNQQYISKLNQALQLKYEGKLYNDADIETYIRAFITKTNNTPNKNIAKFDENEQIAAFLQQEQHKALKYLREKATLNSIHKTLNYYALIDAMFAYYRHLTTKHNVLDYQQLLIKAEQLLTSASKQSGWVMFKMDGGIEHILVDEAQDTSPEQWRIIKALTEEFFTGDSQIQKTRTLFIVGDEKQSIFSFQGADVAEFQKMRSWFSERASQSARALETIALEKSYRSAGCVIEAINAVTRMQQFQGTHFAKENIFAGKVVMLPVMLKTSDKTDNSNEASDSDNDDDNNEELQVVLGKRLAKKIQSWMEQGKYIESAKRNIQPEDVMVLVRRRSALVQTLTNELKRYGIAVQGTDRLTLTDHIAVQDMIAFGRWLTLPEDDYALACILRSPLGMISDDALFSIAHKRDGSLWDALQKAPQNEQTNDIISLLKRYLNKVDNIDAYQLFYQLLYMDKKSLAMSARLGNESVAILEEFLNQAQIYQSKNPASMQGFIQYIEENSIEIKCNNSLPNAVRIMTVHGAKGLEAPIVILADTADSRKPREDVSWLPTSIGNLPYCMPEKISHNEITKQFAEAIHAKHMQEYQRLLYVAITRAKDELIITGYRASTKPDEHSWYALLEKALVDIAEFQDHFEDDVSVHIIPSSKESHSQQIHQSLPEWLLHSLSPPENKPKQLKASELNQFKQEAKRQTDEQHITAKDFGVLLHRCIETMFSINDSDVTQADIEKTVNALPTSTHLEIKQKLTSQLTNLITYSDTAFLFKKSTRLVETPMSGSKLINGIVQQISAVIDLCVIQGEIAWLVDFKTSEHVPSSTQDIPKNYLSQLAIYKQFLANIFPEKTILTALVWTAAPYFQEIPEALLAAELLDEAQAAPYILND